MSDVLCLDVDETFQQLTDFLKEAGAPIFYAADIEAAANMEAPERDRIEAMWLSMAAFYESGDEFELAYANRRRSWPLVAFWLRGYRKNRAAILKRKREADKQLRNREVFERLAVREAELKLKRVENQLKKELIIELESNNRIARLTEKLEGNKVVRYNNAGRSTKPVLRSDGAIFESAEAAAIDLDVATNTVHRHLSRMNKPRTIRGYTFTYAPREKENTDT